MNEDILGLLGVDVKGAKEKAFTRGLLSTIFNAAQLAGPQARPISNVQALGQLGLGAMEAYDTSFDRTLKEAMTGLQLKDVMAKREREANLQKAIQGAYTTQPKAGLGVGVEQFSSPITQAEIEAFGPTAYAEAARTAAPMERTFDRNKALEALAQYGGNEGLAAYLTATKPAEAPEAIRTLQYLLQNPELAQLKAGLARAGATNINMGAPGKEFVKMLGDQITAFKTQGMAARNTLPTLDSMSQLLDSGVKTGFGAETMLGLQRAGQLFNPDFKVKETAGQEAFLAGANEVILPQVKKLGVNPTDNDLKFIERGSPTLGKSVEGNKLMLDALKIKFQRDALLQEFSTQWQVQNAGLINSDPVTADAKFNQDLVALTQTHPLYTQASTQLRDRYQQITGSKAADTQPLLRQGGFIK